MKWGFHKWPSSTGFVQIQVEHSAYSDPSSGLDALRLRLVRFLTTPWWRSREKLQTAAARERFVRVSGMVWDQIHSERIRLHNEWIKCERMGLNPQGVTDMKAKDEALNWVLGLPGGA